MKTVPSSNETKSSHRDDRRTKQLLTIPNLLCAIRLLGSPLLIVLAAMDQPYWFLGLFITLSLTDWLDGKLSLLLKQRSMVGPRLDSVADVAMYAGTMIGIGWLKWNVLLAEIAWLAPALATYLISIAVAVTKFGRFPSYHTRAAKTCWLLIALAIVAILVDWSLWPFRIAMVAVGLANIESTVITFVLRRKVSDVPSIFHIWRNRSSL